MSFKMEMACLPSPISRSDRSPVKKPEMLPVCQPVPVFPIYNESDVHPSPPKYNSTLIGSVVTMTANICGAVPQMAQNASPLVQNNLKLPYDSPICSFRKLFHHSPDHFLSNEDSLSSKYNYSSPTKVPYTSNLNPSSPSFESKHCSAEGTLSLNSEVKEYIPNSMSMTSTSDRCDKMKSSKLNFISSSPQEMAGQQLSLPNGEVTSAIDLEICQPDSCLKHADEHCNCTIKDIEEDSLSENGGFALSTKSVSLNKIACKSLFNDTISSQSDAESIIFMNSDDESVGNLSDLELTSEDEDDDEEEESCCESYPNERSFSESSVNSNDSFEIKFEDDDNNSTNGACYSKCILDLIRSPSDHSSDEEDDGDDSSICFDEDYDEDLFSVGCDDNWNISCPLFISFEKENGEDECDGAHLKSINEKWNAEIDKNWKSDTPSKVKFCEEPEVHLMDEWVNEYHNARIGTWHLDAARFKDRISLASRTLNPILDSEHRRKIYSLLYSDDS